jgi:hypothetical protein
METHLIWLFKTKRKLWEVVTKRLNSDQVSLLLKEMLHKIETLETLCLHY